MKAILQHLELELPTMEQIIAIQILRFLEGSPLCREVGFLER
jgi:hypothetical protein